MKISCLSLKSQVLIIVWLVVLVLPACTSRKPEVATAVELEQLAHELIVETIFLRTIAQACNALGGQAASKASQIYQSWMERNWKWIYAADNLYSQKLQPEVVLYQNKKIALAALRLLADEERRAKREIGFHRRTSDNRAKTCEKKLADYDIKKPEAQKDTSSRKQALQTLFEKYGGDSDTAISIYRIPLLAGDLYPQNKPGRMLYTVERSLLEHDCQQPKLLTLKNSWPHEAYAAYCNDKKQLFIACEWSSCSIR